MSDTPTSQAVRTVLGMDSEATLSSFVPLIAKASAAFGTDFRYAEAIAKQAGTFARTAAADRRTLSNAA